MIFSIVICILLAAIVFFHYLQGFLSATISAVVSVIAAVLAFSWHETIVQKFLGGKMANVADSMVLVALFALIYFALRTIFDKAVPGNVRVPAVLDKIGGALMGLVAGVFALGILAIAAQELPIGPTVAGYAKYDVGDRSAQVPGRNGQMQDGWVYETLKSDDSGEFDNNDRKILFPPVDDIVLATVRHLSDSGSMQGSQPLEAVHPHFLQEIFGERLGIQAGASHVIVNLKQQTEPSVEITQIATVNQVRVDDPELSSVRKSGTPKVPLSKVRQEEKAVGIDLKGKPIMQKIDVDQPRSGQLLVVVRVLFGIDATDRDDGIVRFSTGSIRLLTMHREQNAEGKLTMVPHDYYPLGTLEFNPKDPSVPTLYADKLDDFLMVDVRGHSGDVRPGVDLVFAVEKDGFVQGDSWTIANGSFIEIKRMIVDLSGKKVSRTWLRPDPAKLAIGIIHPGDQSSPSYSPAPSSPAPAPVASASSGTSTAAPAANASTNSANTKPNVPTPPSAAGALLDPVSVAVSNQLPVPVGVPASELTKPLITLPNVSAEMTLKNKKYQDLSIDAKAPLADLAKGDFSTKDLFVPDTRRLVQVVCTAPASNPWGWAQDATAITLSDSAGADVKVSGVFAVVHEGDSDKLFAHYSSDPDSPLTDISPVPSTSTPTKIWLAFMLPNGATPKELKLNGKVIKDVSALPAAK